MRRVTPDRSDEQVLAHLGDMALLQAIKDQRIVRGEGGERTIWAPHMLDGVPVRLPLCTLAREGFIWMPISGPPSLTPRGERLLRTSSDWID